ncbi:MAG: hypothetical protein HY260_17560 [Chloroflexi bacterium]|nr:hypothetical protein [Chloroflexota bacterium]
MKASRLLLMVVVLLGVTLACELGAQPPPAATPTATPGRRLFGAACLPEVLYLEHGQAGEIKVEDVEGAGKVTGFRIASIRSGGSPAGQGYTQSPKPNENGWSPVPGAIQVPPYPVDGPPRGDIYTIEILVGGGSGTDYIVGGNITCLVVVLHTKPTPTPTPTPTLEPAPTLTPTPPFITTGDGFRVTYTGPLQAQTGGRLEATFQIVTPDGLPAKGTLSASLGDPPSDPKASHASGELDAEGKVTLFFDVNWPAGTTKLYISHGGKVYQVTEITINP